MAVSYEWYYWPEATAQLLTGGGQAGNCALKALSTAYIERVHFIAVNVTS